MKTFKSIGLSFLFILLCFNSKAQYDSVKTTRPNQINYRFYYDGVKADSKLLKVLVKPNSEALKWIKKVRRKAFLANCFGFVGGYIIGWQIVNELWDEGDNPLILNNPLSISVGIGSMVLGFGIERWSNQNLYKGVQIWNKEIKENLISVGGAVNDDQSIGVDSLAQVTIEPKKQSISKEEKILNELASKKELKISIYAKIEEVEIGDYVVFASPFGEQIFGIVDSKNKSNAIEVKTFSSIDNALIQTVIWSELKKVEMTREANEVEK